MEEWNKEKKRTRLFSKPTEGCKPFIGWDKVKIAPHKVDKLSADHSNINSAPKSRFRFKRGEDCLYCKRFISDESSKNHVLRCHPKGRCCHDCNFVTEDGLKHLQQHRREMHKNIHECVPCNFCRVDGNKFKKHFDSKQHKLVTYNQIMVFNEIVEKFLLPVNKIVIPSLVNEPAMQK